MSSSLTPVPDRPHASAALPTYILEPPLALAASRKTELRPVHAASLVPCCLVFLLVTAAVVKLWYRDQKTVVGQGDAAPPTEPVQALVKNHAATQPAMQLASQPPPRSTPPSPNALPLPLPPTLSLPLPVPSPAHTAHPFSPAHRDPPRHAFPRRVPVPPRKPVPPPPLPHILGDGADAPRCAPAQPQPERRRHAYAGSRAEPRGQDDDDDARRSSTPGPGPERDGSMERERRSTSSEWSAGTDAVARRWGVHRPSRLHVREEWERSVVVMVDDDSDDEGGGGTAVPESKF